MEQKKYPIKHLKGKHGLYFVIILVALLALLYIALEWKTPFDDGGYDMDHPREDVRHATDSSVILRTKARKGDSVSE